MSQQDNPFQTRMKQDIYTGEWKPEGPGIPPMAILIAIPFILISSIFLIPVFPIAATVAAIVGYLSEIVIGMIWNTDQWTLWTLMGLVMLVGLFLALPIENRIARASGSYRYARHWIRVVGLALMINELGIAMACSWIEIEQDAPPWGLLSGITVEKLIRVAIFALIVHVIFRLIDTRGRGLRLHERLGPPTLRRR